MAYAEPTPLVTYGDRCHMGACPSTPTRSLGGRPLCDDHYRLAADLIGTCHDCDQQAEIRFNGLPYCAVHLDLATGDMGDYVSTNGHREEEVEPASYSDRMRRRLHIGAAVCDIPPPVPLVERLLFTPGLSFVYGEPKVGKSFFELDLALSIATGRPFMGHDVTTGDVVYVVAEGVGGIGNRVAAWCAHYRMDPLTDLERIAFLTQPVNLSVEMEVAAFAHLIAERRPILTVIDTLARCTLGVEENSAKDMGVVVGALDRLRDVTGGHVSVVHHAGKDSTRGLRGSNAIRGAADTVISLVGESNAIKASVEDQKDAEELPPWWCHLVASEKSVVMTPASGVEALTGAMRTVLESLEMLPDEDRTSTKWQEMAEANGVSRAAFFTAKKELQRTQAVYGKGGRGALYTIPQPVT